MRTVDVVVGGQFGSESKGRVAADVAARRAAEGSEVLAVRVAGPNAGHVVIDEEGRRFALRQLPVAAVSVPSARLLIAAGSEVDVEVLRAEVEELEAAGHLVRGRLLVHESATVITQAHKEAERGLDARIGSTAKGIGAARAARALRTAPLVRDFAAEVTEAGGLVGRWDPSTLAGKGTLAVVIEGTQGFGLGVHGPHYPQVTSSDCRAVDFLAMAGVNPWAVEPWDFRVHVVFRMYPIRVAGNSGSLQGETTWADLGLAEERTTVTQKVRRVGAWDWALFKEAIKANGPGAEVALAMVDQRWASLANVESLHDYRVANEELQELQGFIEELQEVGRCRVTSLGTGPRSTIWLKDGGEWA